MPSVAENDQPALHGRKPLENSWPEERTARLIQLWEEGLTTAKIAEALGVTKNVVIGRVHRLGLKKRESPIERVETHDPYENFDLSRQEPRGCRYVFGDVRGSEPWYYCQEPQLKDSSYCDGHHATTHMTVSTRKRTGPKKLSRFSLSYISK